jgi:hypothetical protein
MTVSRYALRAFLKAGVGGLGGAIRASTRRRDSLALRRMTRGLSTSSEAASRACAITKDATDWLEMVAAFWIRILSEEEMRTKIRASLPLDVVVRDLAFAGALAMGLRGAVIVAMGKMCVQNAYIANFLFYPSI